MLWSDFLDLKDSFFEFFKPAEVNLFAQLIDCYKLFS